MNQNIENGTRNIINGKPSIFYDGYWIRYYAPPVESLSARKELIESLTKRAFHHTEEGINTPGGRLDLARRIYHAEKDPSRKRVNAAMLAGALFNRATDIFTTVVALGEKGVEISPDNELMRQCGEYFKEALELGKYVKHYSGQEGIDEVWGEPFKAFTLPMAALYESRYLKIANTMAAIDKLAQKMITIFDEQEAFKGIDILISEFAKAAQVECETMKSDRVIFKVWPRFVSAGEALMKFQPNIPEGATEVERWYIEEGQRLLQEGKEIVVYLAGARVPMPTTTSQYHDKCNKYYEKGEVEAA